MTHQRRNQVSSSSETGHRLECQNQSPLCHVKSSSAEQRTAGSKEPERGGQPASEPLLRCPGRTGRAGRAGQSPGTGHQVPVGPESAGAWLTATPGHRGPVLELDCGPAHTPKALTIRMKTRTMPEREPVTVF